MCSLVLPRRKHIIDFDSNSNIYFCEFKFNDFSLEVHFVSIGKKHKKSRINKCKFYYWKISQEASVNIASQGHENLWSYES